jgi:hypothetical protein
LTLAFSVSDRLYAAAEEWADRRLEDIDDALATKVEQSLLEIEHLVSGSHEVEFEVDGREIRFEPTEELSAFLSRQADETGLTESAVLKLHVDLYANTFLEEAQEQGRPPDAPPPE